MAPLQPAKKGGETLLRVFDTARCLTIGISVWYEGKKARNFYPNQLGIKDNTYYRWKKEYGGLDIDQARRLKVLESENARLKKLVADLSLDNAILKEVAVGGDKDGVILAVESVCLYGGKACLREAFLRKQTVDRA